MPRAARQSDAPQLSLATPRRLIEGTPRRAADLTDAERGLIFGALIDNLLANVLADYEAAGGHSEAEERKGDLK